MSIRLLVDENFPAPSTVILRMAGYDVLSVAESAASTEDPEVLAWAVEQQCWIVTFDRDYGDLIFRRGLTPPSCVLYLRLQRYRPEAPGHRLVELLKQHSDLAGYFVVIEDDGVRIRPLVPGK